MKPAEGPAYPEGAPHRSPSPDRRGAPHPRRPAPRDRAADTKAHLRASGVVPRKRWGQNFLVQPGVTERLVAGWDLPPGSRVCEIGPGAGALTARILARGGRVWAIERDRRLCELLRERFAPEIAGGRLVLIEGDVLALTGRDLAGAGLTAGPPGGRPLLVGNLPYAITTLVIEWAIEHKARFAWCSFMVQREYGSRLTAAPGTAAYGSLTLWAGYHFRAEKEMAVGRACFWPMPNVESVVVRLTPWARPPVEVPSAADYERVVRAAFAHRRKMLGGALTHALGLSREAVHAIVRSAGGDPRVRAEQCDAAAFAALARAYRAHLDAPASGGQPARGDDPVQGDEPASGGEPASGDEPRAGEARSGR